MIKKFSIEVDFWDSATIYEKILKEDDGWLTDIAVACLREEFDAIVLDVIGPKYFEGELITEKELPHKIRVKIPRSDGEVRYKDSKYPAFVDLIKSSFTVTADHYIAKTIITVHYVFEDWYY